MRSFVYGVMFFFCAAGLLCGAPASEKNEGRINKKQLLNKDRLYFYSGASPWGHDKWKVLCCPVRKVVRRNTAQGKWTDYCYNAKDELIGIYRRDGSGAVKRSDFSTIPGCTLCGNRQIKQTRWRHNTRPGVVIPPQKKKRR